MSQSTKGVSLSWYVNRLRTMSLGEVVSRVVNLARTKLERLGAFRASRSPVPDLGCQGVSWVAPPESLDAGAYVEQARAFAAGHLPVFALDDANLGSLPEWNRDPLTGTLAPLDYGKTLNYRDQTVVGDIKYLWEPNRHLHLVRIAQAYALTGDEEHLQALRVLLVSWLDQCPYTKGPNWTSSLELGIRLINWSLVWQLVGGLESPLFQDAEGRVLLDRMLASIHQHVHFIHGHYSRFSSANNHRIGEAAGVFVAAATWPYWPFVSKAGARAKRILEQETVLQNHEDGVNKEQAIAYQQFVFDFLLLAGLAARAQGSDFPDAYWGRIERMAEFVASIMDCSGNVPMFGDADDGYVVNLSAEKGHCPYRPMLASCAVLFQRSDFRFKAGSIDHKSLWLLGRRAGEAFGQLGPAPTNPQPVRRQFDLGGYYILGSDFETPSEVRMLMDCGPLGYLSIAAHGHADALAVTLSAGGREILVDSGTYAYHTNKKWRDYFRGTGAHNTVRIDGRDQSEMGGNFMWVIKARATLLDFVEAEGVQRIVGEHDGYLRLGDPVLHRREIVYEADVRRFLISDHLLCGGEHDAERLWHFSEHCRVSREGDGVVARCNGARVILRDKDSRTDIQVHIGDEDRPSGWVSRRFDVKVPTTTVALTNRVHGDTILRTEIVVESDST